MANSMSPPSLLASELYASVTSSAGQAGSTSATAVVSAAVSTSTSTAATSSTEPLAQDMASLLQDLASGNVSGAQSDITKIKADLQAQQSTAPAVTNSAVRAGHGRHHETAASSSDSSTTSLIDSSSASTTASQPTSPLGSLLSKISSSLGSGSTAGALQHLASFLVQDGQGTGNLINLSA